MTLLDELSGFEFEDLMVDVFRELGYEEVRNTARVSDMGRDILMKEVIDGKSRQVIVECKNTDTVSRPVVQKLDSAISSFDYNGPKRGIIVTTGRFTGPAEQYAEELQYSDNSNSIDLIDGRDLRDIADEIGLDLKNGRIQILCDECLRPYDKPESVISTVQNVFRDINNFDVEKLPSPEIGVVFRPVVSITADTNAVFKTSVGVIHRINKKDTIVIRADREKTDLCEPNISELVTDNLHTTVDLNDDRINSIFDSVDVEEYGLTQTEYKEQVVGYLRGHHTTSVSYTGDNNVTYNKICKPKKSDVTVQDITPVYLPEIQSKTEIQEYSYPFEYYAAGPSRETSEDGIRSCVHCDRDGEFRKYTYCDNCGSINCRKHTKTERVKKEPICTGCAVTERFFLKTKYFYNQDNLETFQEQYEQMPLYRKALENKLLVVAGLVATILLSVAALVSLGVL